MEISRMIEKFLANKQRRILSHWIFFLFYLLDFQLLWSQVILLFFKLIHWYQRKSCQFNQDIYAYVVNTSA